MTAPHPWLLAFVADREAAIPDGAGPAIVDSAIEHRVDGLLWTAHRGGLTLPAEAERELGRADLARRTHQRRLWEGLEQVARVLDARDVPWALLKGLGTQARFYARDGERPCGDLDVWVGPAAHDRVGEIVRALRPDHALVDVAQRIIDDGDEQAIEIGAAGVAVDLHTDVLKTRLPMHTAQEVWASTTTIAAPTGRSVRVLSPEATLLHHVVHLNKDRFRFLLGYVDVARIAAHVDPARFWTLAEREGLGTHVTLALHAVGEVVPLPWELPPPPPGWRARVWRQAWPPSVRLSGMEGLVRYRHRQDLLSLTAVGRTGEFLATRTRQRLFPPAERIDQVYPGLRGPYLWRLTAGRVRAMRERRRT